MLFLEITIGNTVIRIPVGKGKKGEAKALAILKSIAN